MRKWSPFVVFLIIMHLCTYASAETANVHKQKLGPFYYTVYQEYSEPKWDIGVLNQQDKTNIRETKLNNEALKLFKETVDDIAMLAVQFASITFLLVISILVFAYRRKQKHRSFMRILLLFSSGVFILFLHTSLELFKKTEQAKSLFYLL
ncbi:hypothetical protein FZC66_06890 [Priestia megaterium]|nr:hypothetical protein FZC66_06890 [Priestia megaterium]